MEILAHNINGLFAQLGLPDSDNEIADFIERHKPVAADKQLYELDIFNNSQKNFLREALQADADWAEAIDTLNSLLRHEADIRPA